MTVLPTARRTALARRMTARRELAVLVAVGIGAVLIGGSPDDYGRGLVRGAFAALTAIGVVLVSRANGFVSFAQAPLAALSGTLVMLAGRPAAPIFVPVAIGAAGGLAWCCHRLLFRRLDGLPRAVPTLAGLLLLQVFMGLCVLLVMAFGLPDARPPVAGPLGFADVAIVCAGLAAAPVVLRWQRRPRTVAQMWWAAGLLAGVAGALDAFGHAPTFAHLSGAGLPVLPLLPLAIGLMAAAIAGFSGAGTAAAAAFTLSVAEHIARESALPPEAFQVSLLPIVGAALMLRRRADATGLAPESPNGSVRAQRPATLGWPGTAVFLFLAGVPVLVWAGRTGRLGELAAYSLVALSLMVLLGWVGQVTLGQLGFALLGGAVAAWSGLPYLLAIAVGGLVGAVVSPLVALPAVRHAGAPAPVVSLTFGLFAQAVFLAPGRTGVTAGQPLTGDATDRQSHPLLFVIVAAAFCAVALAGRTRWSRVLAQARTDPGVALREGVNLMRRRLCAFVLTGFLASTAGALLYFEHGGLVAGTYRTDTGIQLLSWSGLGGMGAIAGPLAGTVVFGLVMSSLAEPASRYAATGVLGLFLVRWEPHGLVRLLARMIALLTPILPRPPEVPTPLVVVPAVPGSPPSSDRPAGPL